MLLDEFDQSGVFLWAPRTLDAIVVIAVAVSAVVVHRRRRSSADHHNEIETKTNHENDESENGKIKKHFFFLNLVC